MLPHNVAIFFAKINFHQENVQEEGVMMMMMTMIIIKIYPACRGCFDGENFPFL